jgi:hypothetical protein
VALDASRGGVFDVPVRGALLVLVAAIATAGCGAVENERNLVGAVERTEASPTVRFEIRSTTRFDDSSLPMVCVGVLDRARGAASIECEWGASDAFAYLSIGNTTYVRYPRQSIAELPAGKVWVKVPAGADDPGPIDELRPEAILGMLRKASSETERIGREDVRGVPTVRYRLTVACDGAQLACDGMAPVDVWIDEDGLLRRIETADDVGEATIEFFDFGAAVEIEPPSEDEVIDADVLDPDPAGVGPARCSDDASPITVTKAIRALRAHGFDVERDELGCGPGVAGYISNFGSAAQEGTPFLSCHILAATTGSMAPLVVHSGDGKQVRRELRNLYCTLEAQPTQAAAVAQLDAALAELDEALGP